MAGSAKQRKPNDDGKAKKISPYFNFCSLNREKVKQSNPETTITKALSLLWKSLSDSERAAYSHPNLHPPSLTVAADLTPDDQTKDKEEDANNPVNTDGDDGLSDDALISSSAPLFPLARVRRIMKLDKDIIKVNRDVLHAVTIATESFLELMAEAALRVTVEKKHKTIRFDHVVTAISRQRRMADFLEDSIADIVKASAGQSDEEDEEGGEESLPKPSKKSGKTPPPPPPGTRSITDFFASKTAPPASDT